MYPKPELFKKRNLAAPLSFYAKMSTAVVFYRWLCGGKSYHAWLSTLSPPLVKFLCCISLRVLQVSKDLLCQQTLKALTPLERGE